MSACVTWNFFVVSSDLHETLAFLYPIRIILADKCGGFLFSDTCHIEEFSLIVHERVEDICSLAEVFDKVIALLTALSLHQCR